MSRTVSRTVSAFALLLALSAPTLSAQPVSPTPDTLVLTLPQAVQRALSQSEEVALARSQVRMAAAQIRQAYASLFPQVNGSAGYTRTLASAFDTGGGFSLPDSLRFSPDPTASVEERLKYLEDKTPVAALGALGSLFSNLPFGQENAYQFGLSGSQTLFSAQAGVGVKIAKLVRSAARLGETEAVADLRLQVEQAYIQVLVARELVGISEAAIAQAQAFLEQEQLRLRAGRASELEVLRAEVDLENLRPQLVQAQNAADLAMLNLKRLANIPFGQPVALSSPLTLPSPDRLAEADLDPAALIGQRAALQAFEQQVAVRAQQVRLQQAAYLPSVSLSTNYGRTLYPSSAFAFDNTLRKDWTVSVGVQVPIFDGFRRRSQVQQARVELEQAQFQLEQLRESLRLQIEQALAEKRRARSLIAARQRTVAQAARVYRLTGLRYEQGIATQLEVSNARLALLQARSNLVQALADFYIADTDVIRAAVTPEQIGTGFSLPEGDPLPGMDDLPGNGAPGDGLPGGTPAPGTVPAGNQ